MLQRGQAIFVLSVCIVRMEVQSHDLYSIAMEMDGSKSSIVLRQHPGVRFAQSSNFCFYFSVFLFKHIHQPGQ